MNSSWFQAFISAIVVFFCMYLIGAGTRTDSAWTMLSSIIAYWMPSPNLTTKGYRKEEEEGSKAKLPL